MPSRGSLILWVSVASSLLGNDDGLFRTKVAPVLERRCLTCHNDSKQKGGLTLQTAAGLLKGGDSGEAIKPSDPSASLLLDMISGEKPEMPKTGNPLDRTEVDAIRQWIQQGAKWPEALVLRDRSLANNDWWSLQPLRRPELPTLSSEDARLVRTPIDAFIIAILRSQGLRPSPEADRRTLIRRLYFDLVGLPPAPEEVDRFTRDADPLAYEKLVDRLLDSPHYGERWARHWLDVVHYGDTHGYDKDKPRPNAWPYRDYVIRALNEDKPYDRFVHEQLAGDMLWPDDVDAIIATGFIAAGPWDFIGHAEVSETKIDGKVARHLDRDDMVAMTMNTFLSLTVQCAQCHNHKFDPVAQEHYYSLQAVFAALDRADRAFDQEPETGRKRRELQSARQELATARQAMEEKVSSLAGPRLAAIDKQLAELKRQKNDTDENPAYGYHSQIMPTPDARKWVQVDLGEPQPIEQIVYVGCWDAFNNIFHGFGFPPRYKIEISNDAQFQSDVNVLIDHTKEDAPNPGTQPQSLSVGGKPARYVRLTATKLAPRQNDFIFALAELSVLDKSGANIALGKSVTSLDSIEAPPRWARNNLVDGYHYGVKSSSATMSTIANLIAEREQLLANTVDATLRNQLDANKRALADIDKQLAALPRPGLVYCGCVHSGSGTFMGTGSAGGKPREIRILERGNVQRQGDVVAPGTVPIIPGVDCQFRLPADHREGDRRVALAQWITHRDNPLTWRSIVNRVWQYHFGRALVDTPNDFGRMGQTPTHPELLDWLAVEFRDGRRSLKDLHRLMVCSFTYRQISDVRFQISEVQSEIRNANSEINTPRAVDPQTVDAENRLLWRMNRRKLEAECVRDEVLQVAGELDLRMYGPAFQDFVVERPEHSPHYEYYKHDPDDRSTHRRSIYRFLVRSQPQPFMNTLDCADPSQLVDKRNETLTALQALTLLNNKFVVRMSAHFARRLELQQEDLDAQVSAAYRLALSRSPSDEERTAIVDYAKQFGLPNACRVILNLNEFAFVD